MKKYINKVLITIFFITLFWLVLAIKSNAAVTLSVTPSKREVEPGKTFSVTVRVSGGAGTVSLSASNGTLSKSNIWLDNSSETITCTAGSTNGTTISISARGEIGDYATEKDVQKSASASVRIKKKEPPKPEQKPSSQPSTKPTTKPTTTTPKKEDNFYISKLSLKGVKENGEKVDIALSPKFSKKVYKYTCKVSSDIQKIELEKDAGEYTKSIIVTGLKELKEGENTITLKLAAEDHKAKTYTIKVTKEKAEEQQIETSSEPVENTEQNIEENKEESKPIIVSMPLWIFIVMQLGIIVVEVLIICFVPWKKIFKKEK